MNENSGYPALFYWLARLGGLAIAVFLALFATTSPFKFLQLIPSMFVIAVLIISWANDVAGFVGFLVLGIVATMFFSTYKELSNFLLISLPLFMVSLFYLKGYFDGKNRTSTT